MSIHGWKFERKKKSGLFKKTKWKKKILEKNTLEQKQKEKKWRKKRSGSAIWALLCKVSGIDDIWKKKLCSTSL